MKNEKDKDFDSEVQHKINAHIRRCSEEQRREEVSAFDRMCNKFLKFKKGE